MYKQYWFWLESKQINCFVRGETLLRGLELSQGYIQQSVHNFQNCKGYFLCYCVKSVTAVPDTWDTTKPTLLWKCFPNIYLLENMTWLLLFFHTTVLHCVFLQVFHIQNFHCCQLECCRCCHCRAEFCIAGKKSSLRKGIFTLNVWYIAAYLRSRKKLLQSTC